MSNRVLPISRCGRGCEYRLLPVAVSPTALGTRRKTRSLQWRMSVRVVLVTSSFPVNAPFQINSKAQDQQVHAASLYAQLHCASARDR